MQSLIETENCGIVGIKMTRFSLHYHPSLPSPFIVLFLFLGIVVALCYSQNGIDDEDKYTEDYKACARRCLDDEIAVERGEVDGICRTVALFGENQSCVHGPCMFDCMEPTKKWPKDADQTTCFCNLCKLGSDSFCAEKGEPAVVENDCDSTVCTGQVKYQGSQCIPAQE